MSIEEITVYIAIVAVIFGPLFLEMAVFERISKANKKYLFNEILYTPGEKTRMVGELIYYFKKVPNKILNWGTLYCILVLLHISGIYFLLGR